MVSWTWTSPYRNLMCFEHVKNIWLSEYLHLEGVCDSHRMMTANAWLKNNTSTSMALFANLCMYINLRNFTLSDIMTNQTWNAWNESWFHNRVTDWDFNFVEWLKKCFLLNVSNCVKELHGTQALSLWKQSVKFSINIKIVGLNNNARNLMIYDFM